MKAPLATRPAEPESSPRLRALGPALTRMALHAAWAGRHPGERFAERPSSCPPDRIFYRALDGWESPLWHHPGPGEPVILAHGLGLGPAGLDFSEELSLARHLQAAGFDVWLLTHRGDEGSLPPEGQSLDFDFDDIVTLDLPAAIDRVKEQSGADRLLWVGHALGGQLLYGWMARGGAQDIAAAVTLCAPVRFPVAEGSGRVAALAAGWLPGSWRVPARALRGAVATLDPARRLPGLADDVEGPVARGLMLHAAEDLSAGLVRQIALWLRTGSLCDRADQVDYAAALQGLRTPLFALAGGADPLCSPAAARAALEGMDADFVRWEELDGSWGHLDPLVGRRAAEQIYPMVVDWLRCWRHRCGPGARR